MASRIEELTYKGNLRLKQGRSSEGIQYLEEALKLRIDLYGPMAPSVKKACEGLSDTLNGAALKHLQNEEHEEAKTLLRKAEHLTGPEDLITAVTYNNLACYFRRKNKLRTALGYLEKAQKIEMRSRVVANPAGTRLNLCAVLSQLDRHQDALEHAQAAVILLQEELSKCDLREKEVESNAEVLNKIAVLAISYHNIGVEEEYLRHHAESLAAYQRGVEIAERYLGGSNDITKTLVKSCIAAEKHLDKSIPKKPTLGSQFGGAYEAMHNHHYPTRRRAQSAGTSRSNSTTPPSWATGDVLYQSGSSGWASGAQPRNRLSTTARAAPPLAQRDTYSSPAGETPVRQRPASAFAALSRGDRAGQGSSLRPVSAKERMVSKDRLGGVAAGPTISSKRGPTTPRDEDDEGMKSRVVRRPVSAQTQRRPVSASISGRNPITNDFAFFAGGNGNSRRPGSSRKQAFERIDVDDDDEVDIEVVPEEDDDLDEEIVIKSKANVGSHQRRTYEPPIEEGEEADSPPRAHNTRRTRTNHSNRQIIEEFGEDEEDDDLADAFDEQIHLTERPERRAAEFPSRREVAEAISDDDGEEGMEDRPVTYVKAQRKGRPTRPSDSGKGKREAASTRHAIQMSRSRRKVGTDSEDEEQLALEEEGLEDEEMEAGISSTDKQSIARPKRSGERVQYNGDGLAGRGRMRPADVGGRRPTRPTGGVVTRRQHQANMEDQHSDYESDEDEQGRMGEPSSSSHQASSLKWVDLQLRS